MTERTNLRKPSGSVYPYDAVAVDCIPITPDDANDVNDGAGPTTLRGIRVAGGGDVRVTTLSGNVRTIPFLAGETRLVGATRVWFAGTSATGIEGLV